MEPKSFLKSKTIWGVAITLLPQVIELGASGMLGPKVQAAVSGLGALLAIWGRATAKKPIKFVPPALPLLPIVLGVLGFAWIAGIATVQTGCTSTGQADTKLIAQLAVSYGVGKVLENNPDYAERVAAIADEVGEAAGGEASTVDAVMQLAREKIDWAKLAPADANLVNILLITIEAELTKRVERGILSPDKALLVQEVAGWIATTARAYVPPSAFNSHPRERGAWTATHARAGQSAVGSEAGPWNACATRPAYVPPPLG